MTFLTLIGKELKIQLKQIPIYLYTIIVVAFLFSQITLPDKTTKLEPIPTQQYLYEHLYKEYQSGEREVYDQYKLEKIGNQSLTKKEKEKFELVLKWFNQNFTPENPKFENTENHSLVSIKKRLETLDSQLGGNSFYSERILNKNINLYESEIYGSIEIEDPKLILEEVIFKIQNNIRNGKYLRFSMIQVGQYVKISKDDRKVMEEALVKLEELAVSNQYSKKEIYDLLEDMDKKLGGHTWYSKEYFSIFLIKTYEEATLGFETLKQSPDLLTNPYARNIADYMGVICGVLIPCLTSFILLRDEKYNMKSIILLSGYSTKNYILSKVFAAWILMMAPYIIYGTIAAIKYAQMAVTYQISIDFFAFYKYILLWIMPTVFYTISLTFLLSIVFRNFLIPIVISLIQCFVSFMPISGEYSFYRHIIRMNGIYANEDYLKWQNAIYYNRIFYLILSFLFIGILIVLFQKMEKMNWNQNKRFFKDKLLKKDKIKLSINLPRFILLLYYQLKIHFRWNLLIAGIFPFLAPLFWRIQVLEENEVIGMSEMFLPLSSIFLLTTIGIKINIQEELYMKNNVISAFLFLIQIGIAILFEGIVFFVFYQMLSLNGANFDFNTIFFTALSASIAIGLIGNLVSHLTGDIRLGFLSSIAYYLLEFGTKGSITGIFYIFYPLEHGGKGYVIILLLLLGLFGIESWKRKEVRNRRQEKI